MCPLLLLQQKLLQELSFHLFKNILCKLVAENTATSWSLCSQTRGLGRQLGIVRGDPEGGFTGCWYWESESKIKKNK